MDKSINTGYVQRIKDVIEQSLMARFEGQPNDEKTRADIKNMISRVTNTIYAEMLDRDGLRDSYGIEVVAGPNHTDLLIKPKNLFSQLLMLGLYFPEVAINNLKEFEVDSGKFKWIDNGVEEPHAVFIPGEPVEYIEVKLSFK